MDNLTETILGIALLGLVLAGLHLVRDRIRRPKDRLLRYGALGFSGLMVLCAVATVVLPLAGVAGALMPILFAQVTLLLSAILVDAFDQIQAAHEEVRLRTKLGEEEARLKDMEAKLREQSEVDRGILRGIAAQPQHAHHQVPAVTLLPNIPLLPEHVDAN